MTAKIHLARVGKLVGSALLLSFAFPPFNFAPTVFIALIPLFWVLSESTPKQAWRAGYLFGLVFSLGELHWLDQLTVKWTSSIWLGLVPWLLASVAMACYFGLAAFLIQRCLFRKLLWAIPLVWAGVEVFRTYIPVLAFPWGLLATPLWKFPILIQPAHLGTIYAISAWVAAVNLLLYIFFFGGKQKVDFRGLAIAVLGFVLVSVALLNFPTSGSSTKITIGQPGIDMAFEKPERIEQEIPDLVRRFSASSLAAKSRLLILPEGIAHSPKGWEFLGFPIDPKMPVLFGAQRVIDAHTSYQSAVGFDGQWHAVDKTRLVIFGEFVPGRDFLPFLDAFGLPGGDLSAGKTGVQSMNIAGMRIGPLLCFEGLFPDLSYRQALNGAQFIPIMSDDDWFMGSSAPQQLRAAAIWRAVETGLPVVRVGSLGYSLACDGKGITLATVKLGESLALTTEVPIARAPKWIALLPIFPIFCLITTLALLFPRFKNPQTLARKDGEVGDKL